MSSATAGLWADWWAAQQQLTTYVRQIWYMFRFPLFLFILYLFFSFRFIKIYCGVLFIADVILCKVTRNRVTDQIYDQTYPDFVDLKVFNVGHRLSRDIENHNDFESGLAMMTRCASCLLRIRAFCTADRKHEWEAVRASINFLCVFVSYLNELCRQ